MKNLQDFYEEYSKNVIEKLNENCQAVGLTQRCTDVSSFQSSLWIQ